MKDDLEEDESGASSSGVLPESTTYGNPRASRNMAEKQRRDNLNTNISTMAALVPTVAGSSRKMDKISILRLAAAYLRTQYTLGPGTGGFLPRQFSDFDLEQYFVDNIVGSGGFLMVVTTTGKIVYISRHVEQQLGHAQNELLGQSLYNFVCPDDHEELTRSLTPDDAQSTTTTTATTTTSTSTSTAGTVRAIDDNSNSSENPSSPKTERKFTEQRRSFNVRMSQRAVSRREHTQYEYLRVTGILRLAESCRSLGTNGSRSRHREINSTSNDIVFVGIAKMLKKRMVTELTLLEASKDEYVTRHLVDGRIIFCDHRISVVAGYMTEEVSGLSAFKFMHKDDVRWTMIGLRQMYDRGEGYGTSCYRLLSKTGEFIYLRTHGYLEFDKNTQTVESFICINTLMTEKEGIELVKEMKSRFSATVSSSTKAIISDNILFEIEPETQASTVNKPSVEEPSQLEEAINHLISNLSPAGSEERLSPSPLPNPQYAKAAIYSQRLPPVSVQATKVGIKRTDKPWPVLSEKPSAHLMQQESDVCSTSRGKFATNGKLEQESSLRKTLSPREQFGSPKAPVPDKRIPELDDDESDPENETATRSYVESTRGKVLSDEISSSEEENSESGIFATNNEKIFQSTSRRCATATPRERDDEEGSISSSSEGRRSGRPSVVRRSRLSVESIDAEHGHKHRGKPESMLAFVEASDRSKATEDTGARASKRTHSCDQDLDPVSSKRRNDDASSYVVPTEITPFAVEAPDSCQGTYYENGNSPSVQDTTISIPLDLPGSNLQDIEVDDYQLDDADRPIDISVTEDEQLAGFQDLQEGILSPALEESPDLTKIILVDDLQPVTDVGKSIGSVRKRQFVVSDQVFGEEMGDETHLQLPNSIAQYEILDSDLEKPLLQTQRDDFTRLKAECNKQKKILKTLHRDHHGMQVNVKHDIDV